MTVIIPRSLYYSLRQPFTAPFTINTTNIHPMITLKPYCGARAICGGGPRDPLKGHIWRQGYADGGLTGEVYADVEPAFRCWTENGKRLAIYSSGSREVRLSSRGGGRGAGGGGGGVVFWEFTPKYKWCLGSLESWGFAPAPPCPSKRNCGGSVVVLFFVAVFSFLPVGSSVRCFACCWTCCWTCC